MPGSMLGLLGRPLDFTGPFPPSPNIGEGGKRAWPLVDGVLGVGRALGRLMCG